MLAPLRDVGGDGGTQADFLIDGGKPGQAAIRGEASAVEGGFEREGSKGLEVKAIQLPCG